jgi:tetratricopeptide (TPR) repeat protein
VSSVVNSSGLASSGGPLLEEGIAFQKNGQLRRAEEIYRQILQGDPNNADALHLLGTIAFRAGKPADAISLIHKAIQKEPRNPHFYNNCGPALRELGRFDEAVVCYQECLRLDPMHPGAWYNLGKTLADAARPEEALAAYNRQIDLYPDHLSARWNRSLTKLLLGDYAAGWSEYEIRWEATPVKRRKFSRPTWSGEPIA